MHGGGWHAWGLCMAEGACMAGVHVWQGVACMRGAWQEGMHGKGGICGRGDVWHACSPMADTMRYSQ